MSREVHVRFCERPRVKFPRPTHPQITTVQDGKVWLFGVIEHWNAEALGWHVAKRGCYVAPATTRRYDRYPIDQ